MNSPSNGFKNESDELANSSASPIVSASSEPKKGPLSFLSGSITSLSFSLMKIDKNFADFLEFARSYPGVQQFY